jgi:hypothetical protein
MMPHLLNRIILMTGVISSSCSSRTAAKFGIDVAKIFGNANLRFRLYGFKKVIRVTGLF